MKALPAWAWFALGSAFFAGLTAFFGKLGVAAVNADVATFIRTLVILAVTAAVVSLRREWVPASTIPLSSWTSLVLSGAAAGASWLCYYRALQAGPLAKVAPVDKLSIVFAILLGAVVLGEPLTLPVAIGGLLITAGAIVMIFG